MFELSSVAKAIWQFQLTDSMDFAADNLSRIRTAILVEDLTIASWLILNKVALENVTVAQEELSKARAHIHHPVAFVVLFTHITLAIGDLAITVFLAIKELTHVFRSVIVGATTLTPDLSVDKFT